MLNMVQYGTSTKANTAGKGTPIIRMNNIKDGRIDISDLKHIELPASERAGLILKNGDILINRTNSKELVGKCAVFDKPGDYVFASYLIRLRVDPEMDDPWFVAFLINSPIGRQQVDMVSRQIIGQANINTEEIRSFDIPRPTLTEQKKIMDRVQRNMADVDKVIAEADEVAKQAKADIEELILGRKSFRH
jgi:restriction endonuclease S subunit